MTTQRQRLLSANAARSHGEREPPFCSPKMRPGPGFSAEQIGMICVPRTTCSTLVPACRAGEWAFPQEVGSIPRR